MGIGQPWQLGRSADAHRTTECGLHMVCQTLQFSAAAGQHNVVPARVGKAHFLERTADVDDHGIDALRDDRIQLRAGDFGPFGLAGIARRADVEAFLMVAR